MKLSHLLLYVLWAVLGTAMLIGGIIYLVNGIWFQQSAVKITAEIVDIQSYEGSDGEMDYNTFVTYEYNGVSYERISLGEYSSNMYIGKKMNLLCDPNNPQHIMSTFGIYFAGGGLLLIGIVFILMPISSLVDEYKKVKIGIQMR